MTTRARALYESLLWRVDDEYTPPTVAEVSSQNGIENDTVLTDNSCCDACIIEVDQATFEAMLDPTPDPAPRLREMVNVAAQ